MGRGKAIPKDYEFVGLPEYVDVQTASRKLRVNYYNMLKLIKSGKIPSIRVGVLYRIPLSFFDTEAAKANQA